MFASLNAQCLTWLELDSKAEATDVSADGRVVVGRGLNARNDWYAFRWVEGRGMQNLGTLGGRHSRAYGVSADGAVVVGSAYNASGEGRAFRWVEGQGMQELGMLDSVYITANDVSADGTVVVGEIWNASFQPSAFRWTPTGGTEDLNQTYASLLTDGSRLEVASAISPDGRYIVGHGRNARTGRTDAFLLDTQCCGVAIESCPNHTFDSNIGYLWHGETYTFRANADRAGGTFQWQVIQQNNQLSPTSGTGPTFEVRAVNPSRDRNDRLTVRVTYTLGRRTCVSECQLVVAPRPQEAHLIYRNESEPMNAYPYEDQNLALWVVIQASDGNYYTGERYDPNNQGVWFSNDNRWLKTGTQGQRGETASFNPQGQAWNISSPVYKWWGPQLGIIWYRLEHKVDDETRLTSYVTQNVIVGYKTVKDRKTGQKKRVPIWKLGRYFIYPPYHAHLWSFLWGIRNVTLPMGTHRFQVRVNWVHNDGRRYWIASQGPTPGHHPRDRNHDPNNRDVRWSQNCDEEGELAVRISVRARRPDVAEPHRRAYLEWMSSFIGVPYEWGGIFYGGRADATVDRTEVDNAYNGYGIDCSGLVSAAARWAGYWGNRFIRLTTRALLNDPNNIYTQPVSIGEAQPGDIVVWQGHVVTIWEVDARIPDSASGELTELVYFPIEARGRSGREGGSGSQRGDTTGVFPQRTVTKDEIRQKKKHIRRLVYHGQ